MRPAFTHRKPRYPKSWQELPCGEQIRDLLTESLRQASRHWFGYHLVKLGALSAELNLPDCPISHQVAVTGGAAASASVLARSRELPLQKRSVDAFVLAFELDFAQDPHQILREVNRAIMPDGHLVLVGFNPLSPAGLAKYLPFRRASLLHDARCFSTMRIKDWLNLLGFEIIEEQGLLHSELLFERHLNPDSRWQRWACRYWRWFGSVYVLVAKRRELPLSLIRPKWSPKPAFIGKQVNI